MEDLVNLIATNQSPSDISDKIKEILYTKSAEKINEVVPQVSASMFGQEVDEEDYDDDYENDEYEDEDEEDEDEE
jgi:hypothetical protein